MNNNFTPTPEKNRLHAIDIVRGFAILGIFMVNIGAFSAPYFMYGGNPEAWDNVWDQSALIFIDIVFQGSFYTLFSLLFGFSWQLMQERLEVRELHVSSFLLRRQLALIGFGVIHAFLLWHGDILLSYGLIGLILLFFWKAKDTTLLAWAGFVYIGNVILITLSLYPVRFLLSWVDYNAIDKAIANYSSGNLSLILQQNFTDWSLANSSIAFLFLIATILPLFLFGMYVARKRWYHDPSVHKEKLIRITVLTFILTLVLKVGPYALGNPLWLTYVQDNFGGAASALFYFTGIVLLVETKIGRKLLQPLRYVGRMALSNYISQSVFCFTLFYLFGFYHKLTPFFSIVVVMLVFVLQIFVSRWWLQHFKYGPLEWAWRSLNYKKVQAMRREKE